MLPDGRCTTYNCLEALLRHRDMLMTRDPPRPKASLSANGLAWGILTKCSFWNFAAIAALAAVGSCQSITKVSAFNTGPTKVGMYVYVPKSLQFPAPIIVAVHYC